MSHFQGLYSDQLAQSPLPLLDGRGRVFHVLHPQAGKTSIHLDQGAT